MASRHKNTSRVTEPLKETLTRHQYITVTSWWTRWLLKSPAAPLFTQLFIQAQIKENIKAPRHWPLCEEFTGAGEFPAQMASNAENVSIWWRHHRMRILTGQPEQTMEILMISDDMVLIWFRSNAQMFPKLVI